jgi:hypothetical protein
MEDISYSQRTPFRGSQVLWMAALVLVGAATGIVVSIATKASHPGLSNAFASGATTLLFGALLGGIVKELFADFDRRRVWRAARVEYIMNVLADLKDVYDQVDRGRTLIAAQKSAKTYGDEMKNFIQARVKLLQVVRALKFDERGSAVAAIRPDVETMQAYLRGLINEFEQNYKEISRAQSLYEARMKKALEQVSVSEAKGPELPGNAPWDSIAALERVSDFLKSVDDCQASGGAKSDYCLQFLRPLDSVSGELRDALSAEFEDRPLFRASGRRSEPAG